MKSLEQKTCSKCSRRFDCGPEAGKDNCWCDQLPHVSLIASEDQDCFCPECLSAAIRKLNCAGLSEPEVQSKDTKTAGDLAEGADYYWEGESMVFTASYHRRRGYCCESGCRHCPYEQAAARKGPHPGSAKHHSSRS